MSANYFRVNKATFHFHDTVKESVLDAWAVARLAGEPIVYKPIPFEGPWTACAIVGHRNRTAIVNDLEASGVPAWTELVGLVTELVSLPTTAG